MELYVTDLTTYELIVIVSLLVAIPLGALAFIGLSLTSFDRYNWPGKYNNEKKHGRNATKTKR